MKENWEIGEIPFSGPRTENKCSEND